MIEDAIKSQQNAKTIFYIDSSISFYGDLTQLFRKGVLSGFKNNKKVVLRFSGNEIQSLAKQARNLPIIKWKDSLFSAWKSIGSKQWLNDYDSAIRNHNEEMYNRMVYHISQPIFIRNNSIAVVRIAEFVRPVYGNDLLFVYQKHDCIWKQKMIVQLSAW
jgi:hypothetical protein